VGSRAGKNIAVSGLTGQGDAVMRQPINLEQVPALKKRYLAKRPTYRNQ
jgi:hypothetical protein